MASALKKLRDIVTTANNRQPAGSSANLDPELGFKASLNEQTKEIKITVIGARHLPTIYGLTRAQGYVVKVWSLIISINFLF